MVVASGDWLKNVNYCSLKNDNNLKSTEDNNKMGAKAILICRENSHVFQDRVLNLDLAIKIGRSVARTRAAADNAIFDCKVLSRNHALLWYSAGKFYLKDTSSSNGTFVNNQRLSATGLESVATEVFSGDIVQFGVDVVESTKKVTHGCIIATLKLYRPDGTEAKPPRSMYVLSLAGDITLEDLYKLNQYVQEANRREELLNSKLLYLQKLVENTRNAASQSWKALIDEDHLLSRAKSVENQLVVYSKKFTVDKVRSELIKLEEEKSQYQIAAKEALQQVHQEKLEVTQKLVQLESRLNETKKECQSLHKISKHAQIELQKMAVKYTDAQKNLAQFVEKLAEQGNSTEVVKWAVQERQDLIKKVKHQSKIGRELLCKIQENNLHVFTIRVKGIKLKKYMQSLQDIDIKLLSDESRAGFNPIEVLNEIIDTINLMIPNNNITDLEKFIKSENIFDIDDNQSKEYEIDSNQEIVLCPDQQLYNKNELDHLNNDCEHFAEYILPPTTSRRTLTNGRFNIDEYSQEQDSNTDTNDETSSVNSDVDTHSLSYDSENCVDKSIIENDLMKDKSIYSFDQSGIVKKHKNEYLNNTDDTDNIDNEVLKIHEWKIIHTVYNRVDGNDSSNSTNSPNEMSLAISPVENHNQNTVNENEIYNNDPNQFGVSGESSRNNEILLEDDSIKLKMEEIKSEKNVENIIRDRRNTKEKYKDNKIDIDNTDENETIDMIHTHMMENKNDERDSNIESDTMKEDGGYIRTLKPFVKNSDNSAQCSHTKDYILNLFMSSLESLKSDDNIEAQQFVKQEIDELRNWIVQEPNDVIIEKLETFYYRAKNSNTRMQEMSEELAILKEKYNICHDEKMNISMKYELLEAQCGDVSNASYSVPIQYFVSVLVAFLWMIFEQIF